MHARVIDAEDPAQHRHLDSEEDDRHNYQPQKCLTHLSNPPKKALLTLSPEARPVITIISSYSDQAEQERFWIHDDLAQTGSSCRSGRRSKMLLSQDDSNHQKTGSAVDNDPGASSACL